MLIGKQSKLPMALQKKIIKAKMKKKKAKRRLNNGTKNDNKNKIVKKELSINNKVTFG